MRPQTIGAASMLHSSLARTAKENPVSRGEAEGLSSRWTTTDNGMGATSYDAVHGEPTRLVERLSERSHRDMGPPQIDELVIRRRCMEDRKYRKVQDDHLCILELHKQGTMFMHHFLDPKGGIDKRRVCVRPLRPNWLPTLQKGNILDTACRIGQADHRGRIPPLTIRFREKGDFRLTRNIEHGPLEGVAVRHLFRDDLLEKSDGVVDDVLHRHAIDGRRQRRVGRVCSERCSGIGRRVGNRDIILSKRRARRREFFRGARRLEDRRCGRQRRERRAIEGRKRRERIFGCGCFQGGRTGEVLSNALSEQRIAMGNRPHSRDELRSGRRRLWRISRCWLRDPHTRLNVQRTSRKGIANLLKIRQPEEFDIILSEATIRNRGSNGIDL